MAIKTEDEFNSYYNEVLSPKTEEVETLRKAYDENRSKFYSMGISIGIIFIITLCIGLSMGFHFISLFFMGPAILLTGIITSIYLQQGYTDYQSKFKRIFIEPMMQFYGPEFKYLPERGISESEVTISKLYPADDCFIGDNYVEGYIGTTFIRFSKGESIKFNGIFIIASFNKYFQGEYLVFSKTSFQKIDKAIHDLTMYPQIHPSNLSVTLENPEFEKEFDVYGSDQVEVRYILSPSLMSRMLDFKKKVGTVHFSFTHSKMFVAVQVPDVDLFKPPTNRPLDAEKIQEWNKYLFYAFNTVEEFNLNTHIWSKP